MKKILLENRFEYELLRAKHTKKYFFEKYILSYSLIQALLTERLFILERYTNCLPCEDENIKDVIGKIQVGRYKL